MKEEIFDENLEHVVCNLCGCAEFKVLFKSTLSEDDFKNSLSQYSISKSRYTCGQVVQCQRCNLVYVNPRDNLDYILENYAAVKDDKYLEELRGRKASFLRGLRLIERFNSRKGRLLDVGCFTGLFLDLVRENGWTALGVEPSQWAVEYARDKLKLNVLQGKLEDIKCDDESFDAVAMWDVVEHLSDPKSTLTLVNKKLKNGGILFLNTPNYDSIFCKIFRRKFWFIERMHLYYFTPSTVRKMLEECNYKVLKTGLHFKTLSLEYFILRLREINITLANIFDVLSSLLFLKKLNLTVYVGQMTVIAKKRETS